MMPEATAGTAVAAVVVVRAGLVVREHGVGVGLALGGVGGGDAIDDGLCLFVSDFCFLSVYALSTFRQRPKLEP